MTKPKKAMFRRPTPDEREERKLRRKLFIRGLRRLTTFAGTLAFGGVAVWSGVNDALSRCAENWQTAAIMVIGMGVAGSIHYHLRDEDQDEPLEP